MTAQGAAAPGLRALDEVAANATVAPLTRLVDGWLAKAAPDLPFRRCNAVLPAVGAGTDPGGAVVTLAALEHWYGQLGQRVLIQVSSSDPAAASLDELLAERGYAVEAPVEILVGAAAEVSRGAGGPPPGVEVGVESPLDEAWAASYGRLHGGGEVDQRRTEGYGRMLAGLGSGALAASARQDGRVVGVGFGVVERGWLGVFGMATAEAERRRGVAVAVLGALTRVAAGWGWGAERVYLQVEEGNAAARALYARAGFTPSHRYHYRVSAPPP